MSGRALPHYGFEVTVSMLPCVAITVSQVHPSTRLAKSACVVRQVPVKRVYGFTTSHAIKRALRWMKSHGDPR